MGDREMRGEAARTTFLIRLLQLELYNQMVERLRGSELTPLQFLVLSLASRHDQWSTADLARRFHIAPQSMNEVVAALEGKKLIARRVSPDHRRILRIRLTAAGTRTLERCNHEMDALERSAFHDFSAKELGAFRAMLMKALGQGSDMLSVSPSPAVRG